MNVFGHDRTFSSSPIHFIMNHKMFLPLVGDKVVVAIPNGLPELSMSIIQEMLRNPPEDERSAYLSIADFLKRLLDNECDGLVDMVVAKLNKTTEETYIDSLLESGYTFEVLEEFATIIQRQWKLYKSRTALRDSDIPYEAEDNVWISKMTTEDAIEVLNSFGIPTKSANEAATVIQRAWRKHLKSKSSKLSVQLTKSSLDVLEYENESDDMERVNVVRKDQIDYVPPIPDFIPDTNSIITGDQLKFSFEDQYEGDGKDGGENGI